jgi:hypothetical protein
MSSTSSGIWIESDCANELPEQLHRDRAIAVVITCPECVFEVLFVLRRTRIPFDGDWCWVTGNGDLPTQKRRSVFGKVAEQHFDPKEAIWGGSTVALELRLESTGENSSSGCRIPCSCWTITIGSCIHEPPISDFLEVSG